MKTVIIKSDKHVELADVPTPHAFENFVLVRIHSAPMCTEYRSFDKGAECINPGHEATGQVVETFPGSRINKGERVIVMPQFPCGQCEFCLSGNYIHCENLVDPLKSISTEYGTGTFAEYILKPDWLLIPIPDDITYDEASMACCGLGPALGAGKAMNINKNDTVLVTGLGPVGLGAVIYCTSQGARVIGISRNSYRRSLATDLGAEITFDPSASDVPEKILKLTNGKGVDMGIECTGENIHQQLAFTTVKRKGQIAFIGESSSFTFNVSRDLLRKGLTLHGIWHWNLNHADEMIALIRNSKEKIHKLITHTFPLEKVEDAFRLQLSGQCGKVILRP